MVGGCAWAPGPWVGSLITTAVACPVSWGSTNAPTMPLTSTAGPATPANLAKRKPNDRVAALVEFVRGFLLLPAISHPNTAGSAYIVPKNDTP
ncbi:MAG: hypothetical protein DLM55_06625 [Acidimicrobiales bacterium]|nr:MAG: hypothetical protein DLM55_06625 [Acidimicrobiales bacterium]